MSSIKNNILDIFDSADAMHYGAKFYKADLHFHTPASEDARGKNKYNFNPYKNKFPQKNNTINYDKTIKNIQENILTDARKIANDIVRRFIEVNLSMVAITDHNGIGTIWADKESEKNHMDLAAPTWYELIDDETQKSNVEAGKKILTVLPGVEISTTGIHILAIFPPQKPRRKIHFIICDLLNEIGFDIDDWGKNPKVGKVSVVDAINLVIRKGGIPIPAHIDGSDQALLELYNIKSGAMKNVLKNNYLYAVEIVNPSRFIKIDSKLKKSLKIWIDLLRIKQGLPKLAYFQGSDAHDLQTIAKRHTFIKMTEPSFSGFKTAIKMPSSRVRISDLYEKKLEGFYIHSMKIDNKFFGKIFLRFNRCLNCITSRKGGGKTFIFNLMQYTVKNDFPQSNGSVTLFIEKIVNSKSNYYVYLRDRQFDKIKIYSIDQVKKSVEEINEEQAGELKIIPKFYDQGKIAELISSKEKFNNFLIKHFGEPSEKNVRNFNEIFSISNFMQQENEKLFFIEKYSNFYNMYININWHKGRDKLKNFFTLSHSLRRTAIMCMIIIMSEFGPTIIDAPEAHFDKEDIVNYLVPIIKKYKDLQQVILFTNDPILAVNTDPDNYILLETTGTKFKDIESGFAIDDEKQRPILLNLFEGNLKSFRKRAERYENNL